MAKSKSIQDLDPDQAIFVGLDVHKNKWSVTILHCNEEIEHFTIPGEFKALRKILERYNGFEIFSAYQAGDFHLHHCLTAMGIDNIVVAPNEIPVKSGDLVKTDRRDSHKLAFSLSKKHIIGVYIPSLVY